MTENNSSKLEEKIDTLAARNSKLEADLSFLASRSQYPAPDSFQSDMEIDLKELWSAIWSGKWLILAITSVFAIGSVLYALSIPNEYQSTAILSPVNSLGSSSLSKMAGQFGGLASLAGINLGGGGAEDKSVVAMEIIKTWGFLENFIQENNIEVELYAAEGWDRSANRLIINPDVYDENKKKWIRKFDPSKGEKAEPSSWQLFKKIQNRISISRDKKSGLISLSVEYFSPELAKLWTDQLVMAVNAHMQKLDREEATKSIEYLNKKISETNVADMQSVFYQLIEEQTKTLMLAEISEEYVLKTLSPAKVAEVKSKPKRALIAVLWTMLGGMLACLLVLVHHFNCK